MEKYEHGGVCDESIRIDFSSNINPLGMSEGIAEALAAIDYSKYPDPECVRLRHAIALHEGVHPDNILCSNGASQMIFNLVWALRPKRALIMAPTFSEYEKALISAGTSVFYYDLREENNFAPKEDILSYISGMDAVILCNPNNPTGNVIDRELMEDIADACAARGAVLVVDECFMDFVSGGYSMKGKKGIAVIRAFTKMYAIPGLRLGYMIASTELIERVKYASPSWSVSSAAQEAGIIALRDSGLIGRTKSFVALQRQIMSNELMQSGVKVYPSRANYILFKSIKPLKKELMKIGIAIRSCANYGGLDHRYYRAAVRTYEENRELTEAVKKIWQK